MLQRAPDQPGHKILRLVVILGGAGVMAWMWAITLAFWVPSLPQGHSYHPCICWEIPYLPPETLRRPASINPSVQTSVAPPSTPGPILGFDVPKHTVGPMTLRLAPFSVEPLIPFKPFNAASGIAEAPRVPLNWPRRALAERVSGCVILRFGVGSDGHATNISVALSSHPMFDRYAI